MGATGNTENTVWLFTDNCYLPFSMENKWYMQSYIKPLSIFLNTVGQSVINYLELWQQQNKTAMPLIIDFFSFLEKSLIL